MAKHKTTYSSDDYINRKVNHMNRIGIPALVFRGAACPVWLKDQIEAKERDQGK